MAKSAWIFCLVLLTGLGHSAVHAETTPAPLDILVIAPHPDDEAIGCSAVILKALEQKRRVGIVLLTNGDAFAGVTVVAKKTKDKLVPDDYLKLAALRQRHTLGAMGRLGVRASDLMFLGYPDGGLEQIYKMKEKTPFEQKFTKKSATYGSAVKDYHSRVHGQPARYVKSAVIGDLAEIIKARRPREIYVTNEADTHADHRAAFWFVRDAARKAGHEGKLFTYVVHGKGPKIEPGRRLVLTKAELDRKRAILKEYQAGLSPLHDNLASKYTKPEEVFWPVEIK